jgi:hypothetical protein
MKKLKHSKIKNTSIIFEVLSSKISSNIIFGEDPKPLYSIMKKFFNPSTELYKELGLYRSLLGNDKLKTEGGANKHVELVLEVRRGLDNDKLREEKYNLVKAIKKELGGNFLDESLRAKFPRYREMASVYKLFEYSPQTNITEHSQCRELVVETLTTPVKPKEVSVWEKESRGIRELSLNILFEKFNKKYANLSSDQKRILRAVLHTPTKIPMIIREDLLKIESILKGVSLSDEILQIKMSQMVSLIGKLDKSEIKDEHISIALKGYSLIDELRNLNG